MISTLKSTTQVHNEQYGERRVVIHDLGWQQYQQILSALPQTRATRLTYATRTLEISMPLEDHEQASELIGLFIRILVLELSLKMKSMGSTTLNREDLIKGSEPDKAYYIQNQHKVAGRSVDLKTDPPPDLIVEIDITHTDIDKNKLYSAMGVPEFWRFNGREWRIYLLQNSDYIEVENSPTFPMVEKEDLYRFLEHAKRDEIAAEIEFRAWVKDKLT